ncbi:4-hydroxy-3-methylbut-2-enyl diphosphate reductase [Stieleria sp. ICT_E10.1]|uniref:4-hydroxy-3-methylbut-2-enyl diphosphate reductase n=1 Tax=Stieleria sedimenti TaxID=2976331 RepID=UPI00217F8F38|nr:4-hydroxy-3-methylbut-2-enyl diphosphate reductase [Stieleria sedimenti]MCS7468228.1 4-hydroxy-3-methylbut-2-enyl diphosphate reductase [Stieleria sedimenti]
MNVIRADEMGMCFGVRDALQIAAEVEDPTQVTIHGELVHNRIVNERLADAGFRQSDEQQRDCRAETPLVLITAHGVSDAERERLRSAGKQLIDTTCPLVRRVHDAAAELRAAGRHVIVIGKRGHVEVQGIVDDLDAYDVVAGVEDVAVYESNRLGIVSQTTMPSDVVESVTREIHLQNRGADIRFVDTVCHPTKRRQAAMLTLLERVDAVVVVGGENSNNTRRLVDLCRQQDRPAFHVQSAEDLRPEWFDAFENIGLTAGTSTLDETIDQVHHALLRLGHCHEETGRMK